MDNPLDVTNKLKEQRIFKIIFLFILGTFLSFIFWFLVKINFDFVFLTTNGVTNLTLTGLTFIFFSLFLAFFANGVYFLKTSGLIFGLIMLVNFPYFFVFGTTLFAVEGFLILSLGLYFWENRIITHKKKNPFINVTTSAKFGSKLIITIFLFVIAFSFYINIAYEGQINYFIPRLEKYVIQMTNQSVKLLLPGYNKNMSINDFLTLISKNKFWKRFLITNQDIDLSNPQTINLMIQGLEKKFSLDLKGKSISVLLKYLVNDYVVNTLLKSQKIFSGAAAIAFFLFLKIFSLLYYFLISIFTRLWLNVLLKFKIIQKTKETIEVEKMVL